MTEAAFKAARARLALVDTNDYTCYDGLTPEGVNQNKEAESLIY
jgi:hypothetical protein